MGTRTRRELIDAVLDNLGILVPGQASTDDQVARVDVIINPSAATLAALDIYYLPDIGTPNPPGGGEIDDAVFLPLADYCAWAAAGGFNLASDPALKTLSDQAEQTLRRIGRPARTRKLLTTDGQLYGSHRVPATPSRGT